jgi:uncharacterized protein
MIRGRCPICAKSIKVAALDDLPSFPFCSERCRLVDLGRWIDGAYLIPGTAKAQAAEEATDDRPDDSDE